ncbi:hypothetical protein I3842_01G115700 [Carya illinoinensis]|uniref:Uncharacterized protein n=1 Tax=Carya illinoinensis TaxID=32201 RepID=A0A922G295_CARIL|nr:hypothetical protein I3842_01G115700 [Carya illinoinensis]
MVKKVKVAITCDVACHTLNVIPLETVKLVCFLKRVAVIYFFLFLFKLPRNCCLHFNISHFILIELNFKQFGIRTWTGKRTPRFARVTLQVSQQSKKHKLCILVHL